QILGTQPRSIVHRHRMTYGAASEGLLATFTPLRLLNVGEANWRGGLRCCAGLRIGESAVRAAGTAPWWRGGGGDRRRGCRAERRRAGGAGGRGLRRVHGRPALGAW